MWLFIFQIYTNKFKNIFGNCNYLSYICLTMKDNKTESITFRTTQELKVALQKMADKDKRSLSNTIEILLEAAIKTSKKK